MSAAHDADGAALRVLVCASEAPLAPLDGLRLQVANICGQLARRHDVAVLAYRWPDQHGEPPAGVELLPVEPPSNRFGARLAGWVRASARGEPIEAVRSAPPMRSALERLLVRREFDVAHVTPGLLAGVAPALGDLPAVMCALDFWADVVRSDAVVARGARRLAASLNERRVRRYEASAYRPYRSVVMVSEQDAAALSQLDPSLRIIAIPNGVDVEHFAPSGGARDPGLVLFTGHMGASPNVHAASWLARDVIPRIRDERSDVRLALVGREPAPAVRELARLDGVEVTGEVPDLRPWLARCGAFACGMVSGAGIKNKLLEALACGAPAVATPLALHGMSVVDGEQLLVADPAEFAQAVVRLLGDAALRDRLSRAGRAYVVANHGWDSCAARFESLYREAVATPSYTEV